MRKVNITLLSCFLLICTAQYARGKSADGNSADLLQAEDSLRFYLDSLRQSRTDQGKFLWNTRFKNCLEKTLAFPGAFDYPFDSLSSIGKLYSPDRAFRIFNWNIEKKDFTQVYYAFVMVPGNKKTKLFELKDMSATISDPENQVCDQRKWYGCLYYEIIISREGGKTEYTLLGLDMNDRASKKRLIEAMSISNDKIQFGLPIFTVLGEDGKKKIQRRIVLEHSSEVQMALKYHPKEKRIVFDHLIPNDPLAEGIREYYVPDGSYEALVLQDSGKWDYLPDVDVRGKKTRIYNDPRKE